MIILGIDPGTARTGFGVIAHEDGNYQTIDQGVIETSNKLDPELRLLELSNELHILINKHRPDAIAIEKIFFNANTKTATAVGQSKGVIMLTAAQNGIPVTEYTPLQVKQAVTGNGRADKRQVQKMIKTLLNLKLVPKPDDAADALAIAICHSSCYKFYKKLRMNN